MNDQDFHAKLGALMKQIDTLPPEEKSRLETLAAETRDRHERMRESIGKLQDSLDYLRLSVKYLVFDLESTRRENEYLRRMLRKETGGEGAD
jgi:hypothetical protein